MRQIRALLLIILVAAIASVALAKPYVSSKGYQITPAEGWVVNAGGSMGTDVIIHAAPSDGFVANLDVIVQPLPPGATLKQLRDLGNTQIRSKLTKYQQISQSDASIDGIPAVKTIGKHRIGAPPREVYMREMIAVKGGMVYTFTCTSLASNHAKYDPAFSAMIGSIKWRK